MHKKIGVEDLTLGMYVAELDRPWLETPFLFQGFTLRETAEIEQLKALCRFVYVDTDRAVAAQAAPVAVAARPAALRDLQKELRVAKRSRAGLRRYLDQALEDVRLGRSISAEHARATVHHLVEEIATHESAALWLTQLKSKDEYTVIHSLNVCVLSIAFGHHLGLDARQLELLGMGALLHDIGKTRIPDAVLNKPGRLSSDEFEVVRRHPVDGHAMATAAELPREVLEAVLYHHERIDGRGYPEGLSGTEIPLLARIVAIADVYDAITSDRVYHRALPAHKALLELHRHAERTFGADLVAAFIQCLGIYPVGSLVRLGSGALALVMRMDPSRRLKPVVLVVRDPQGRNLLPRPILNLAEMAERDQDWERWAIKEVVDPAEHGIDLPALVMAETG